jgi:hypothetical protein
VLDVVGVGAHLVDLGLVGASDVVELTGGVERAPHVRRLRTLDGASAGRPGVRLREPEADRVGVVAGHVVGVVGDQLVVVAVVVLELALAVALEVLGEPLGDPCPSAMHVVGLEPGGADVLRVVVVPARVAGTVQEGR